jgi:hypothetical protein
VDDAKALWTVHWDDLLAAGRRLWGVGERDPLAAYADLVLGSIDEITIER